MKKINQSGFGIVEGLLIVIALTLIVGVGAYVFNSNKKEDKKTEAAQQIQSIQQQGQTKKSEAAPAKELIDYGSATVKIMQKSDVSKLTDASDSFKKYVATLVEDTPKYYDGCENPLTVSVQKIYKDTFAYGGISSCAGAYQVWKKSGSEWNKSLGGQSTPACSEVQKDQIPRIIMPTCYSDPNADPTDNPIQ